MGIPIAGGFADVQETSFEPLPSGQYHISVFEGEVKESGPNAKHPGSQYISWTLNVLEEPYENRKLWLNTSLVTEARGMLKSFLLCFFDEDTLNDSDFELNVEDIVGQEAIAIVTQGINPNTQEPNNSVKRLKRLDQTDSSDLPS
jgi:hypothetical protein